MSTCAWVNNNEYTTYVIDPATIKTECFGKECKLSFSPNADTSSVFFPAKLSTEDGKTFKAHGSYWVQVLSNPLLNDNEQLLIPQPFLIYANSSISSVDIVNLRCVSAWVPSMVINVIFHKAMTHFHESRHIYMNDQVFSSFYSKINTIIGWFDIIKHWSDEFYRDGNSLFDVQNIVHFTVNYPSNKHWMYAFISMKFKSIVVMDSMKDNEVEQRNLAEALKKYMEKEWRERHGGEPEMWKAYVEVKTMKQYGYDTDYGVVKNPKQYENDNDCGVLMLLNALRVMKLLEKDLPFARSKIGEEVSWCNEFGHTELEQIRNTMANVVCGICDFDILFSYTERH